MADADVTVIIPGFNAGKFISSAIESALGQDPAPGVVVVDDGSSDDTVAIARSHDGVEVVEQPNGGPASARNTGLSRATTSKIVFLDADDVLLPGALSAHLEAFAQHSAAVMVMGSNHHMNEFGERSQGKPVRLFETRDPEYIAMRVTPGPSQCMYDRHALLEVGGYDASLRSNEDCDLNLRICTVGSVASHEAFVMARRRHSAQATGRPSKLLRTHLQVMRKHFGKGGLHENPAVLQATTRRWCLYYGQNMPVELVRLVTRGQLGEVGPFLSACGQNVPAVVQGMVSGLWRRASGAKRRRSTA